VITAVEMHGLVDHEDIRLFPKHNIPNNENLPSHLSYKRGEEEGGGDSLVSYSFGSLSFFLFLSASTSLMFSHRPTDVHCIPSLVA
jgi:hypothetical protein